MSKGTYDSQSADWPFPVIAKWMPNEVDDLAATMSSILEHLGLSASIRGDATVWERDALRIVLSAPDADVLPKGSVSAAGKKSIYDAKHPFDAPTHAIVRALDRIRESIYSLQASVSYALAYRAFITSFLEHRDAITMAGVTNVLLEKDALDVSQIVHYWRPRAATLPIIEKAAKNAGLLTWVDTGAPEPPRHDAVLREVREFALVFGTWLLGKPNFVEVRRSAYVAEVRRDADRLRDQSWLIEHLDFIRATEKSVGVV